MFVELIRTYKFYKDLDISVGIGSYKKRLNAWKAALILGAVYRDEMAPGYPS